MNDIKKIVDACRAYGAYPYQSKSSYPDSDAQRNLEGRTHYADPETLKCFKSRILRGTHSKNGLYYILQESLPYGGFDAARQRRNVVFDIFGSVVTDSRDHAHKSAKAADKEYSELLVWMESDKALNCTAEALKSAMSYDQRRINEAANILDGVPV